MKVLRQIKPKWLVATCVLVVYCLGYLAARQSRWLVHRVGFETRTNGSVRFVHYVDRGEVGPAHDGFYWIYTPLRWCEIAAWHVVPREYNFRNGPG